MKCHATETTSLSDARETEVLEYAYHKLLYAMLCHVSALQGSRLPSDPPDGRKGLEQHQSPGSPEGDLGRLVNLAGTPQTLSSLSFS